MAQLARDDVTVDDVRSYVEAACAAQGMSLSGEELERVTEVFARNARVAALVVGLDLPEHQDPAAMLRLD
jgi:hypothetical protein